MSWKNKASHGYNQLYHEKAIFVKECGGLQYVNQSQIARRGTLLQKFLAQDSRDPIESVNSIVEREIQWIEYSHRYKNRIIWFQRIGPIHTMNTQTNRFTFKNRVYVSVYELNIKYLSLLVVQGMFIRCFGSFK